MCQDDEQSFSIVFLIEESAPIEILISGIHKNTGDSNHIDYY